VGSAQRRDPKRLFEVAPETPLPASAYTSRVSRRVYRTLRQKAADVLAAGYSVIVDAVSLKPAQRRVLAAVAEAGGSGQDDGSASARAAE
jgi:uncharacterized protein